MDLLRLVLARLPLQRIIELNLSDLVEVRSKAINCSDTKFENFRQYVLFSMSQGEICEEDLFHINLIAARKVFLGFDQIVADPTMKYFDFELIMRTNVPELQEQICRNVRIEDIAVRDHRSIRWTSEAKIILRNRLIDNFAGPAPIQSEQLCFLHGYLLYPLKFHHAGQACTAFESLKGYIAAATVVDPFASSQLVEDAIEVTLCGVKMKPEHLDDLKIQYGYFANLHRPTVISAVGPYSTCTPIF